MVFRTWDLNFGAWEILVYGFQDMVFGTWDLNFGAWEILVYGFQDLGSQF
jgi:aromatic ring-opening dioxygenase catalytic subunit (LigB family)